MHTALWVFQSILAAAMLATGLMKLSRSRAELQPKMRWVGSFTDQQVRLIGAAETVGAVGLVLPGLLGVLPVLTPIAASCLAFLMGGAVLTHIRLKEPAQGVPSAVLGAMAVFVAIGRFVLVPFV